MYLIIKDPKAGTVSIEEIWKDHMSRMIPYVAVGLAGFRVAIAVVNRTFAGYEADQEVAEELAKSIAIKENLVFTPNTEI
jgi:putative flippase GtrA